MIAFFIYLILFSLAIKSLSKKRTAEEELETNETYSNRSFLSAFFKLNPTLSWLLALTPFIRFPLIFIKLNVDRPFGGGHIEQTVIFFVVILLSHLSLFCYAYTAYSIKNILKKQHSDRFISRSIFYSLVIVCVFLLGIIAFDSFNGAIFADKLLNIFTVLFFIGLFAPIVWTVCYNIYVEYFSNSKINTFTPQTPSLPPKAPSLDNMTDYEFRNFLKDKYQKNIPVSKKKTLFNPLTVPIKKDPTIAKEEPTCIKQEPVYPRFVWGLIIPVLIAVVIAVISVAYDKCFRYSYNLHTINYNNGSHLTIPTKTDNLTGKIYWYDKSKEEWFLKFSP